MSDVYLIRTNQKLNFARLHLDALKAAHDSTSWSKHALIESFQESILFHLSTAYLAFMREIAERYSFDSASVRTLQDLRQCFEQSGQESPEVLELESLQEREDSWLCQMQAAYAACWQATNLKADRMESAQSHSEIQVMQINPDHAEDSEVMAEYQSWLSALRDMVERQRSGMQEW
ncbi:DUF6586 family protein [Nitrincola sp. MINF-07-Sa-05]|uniref:DUF6586 family protein n=1 Tax=Nitrincola salilacus TaxID=3400273 RepID=UPI0039182BE1